MNFNINNTIQWISYRFFQAFRCEIIDYYSCSSVIIYFRSYSSILSLNYVYSLVAICNIVSCSLVFVMCLHTFSGLVFSFNLFFFILFWLFMVHALHGLSGLFVITSAVISMRNQCNGRRMKMNIAHYTISLSLNPSNLNPFKSIGLTLKVWAYSEVKLSIIQAKIIQLALKYLPIDSNQR